MARATVRTTADQARWNGRRFGSVIPKVTRLRHFNATLGSMQEGSIMRSALSAGGDPPPVTMVSDVGPGHPPGTPVPPAGK